MNMNEHFQSTNEDMRFEALQLLRETQANLVSISFLPVIAIMKEENPMKPEVLSFQDDLDELTKKIQEFISKAKNGVDYTPTEGGEEVEEPEEEEPEEEEDEEEEDEEDEEEEDSEEKEKEKKKKEADKKKKKVVDSSEPKE